MTNIRSRTSRSARSCSTKSTRPCAATRRFGIRPLSSSPTTSTAATTTTYTRRPGQYPPDNIVGPSGFDFTRFGVRVPAVLVSPLIPKGTILHPPKTGPLSTTPRSSRPSAPALASGRSEGGMPPLLTSAPASPSQNLAATTLWRPSNPRRQQTRSSRPARPPSVRPLAPSSWRRRRPRQHYPFPRSRLQTPKPGSKLSQPRPTTTNSYKAASRHGTQPGGPLK